MPGGKPGLAIDLLELDGGERREARRLEDHRIAEGERRRRLPAGDLQRIVPGADAGDDAERLAARVAEGLRAEIDVFACRALCQGGEVLNALGAGDDVDDARLLDRLAGIAGFERREFVVARAQDLGCAAQDAGALAACERSPGGLRLARRTDGGLDFAGPATGTSPSRSPVAGLMEISRGSARLSRVLPNSLSAKSYGNTNVPNESPVDRSLVSRRDRSRAARAVLIGCAVRCGLPVQRRRRAGARILPHGALLGHRLDRRHGDDRPREPPVAQARLRAAVTVLSVPVTFASLKNKDIDVFLGNWMPAMAADIAPYVADGSVEVVGANLNGAKYTLAVPAYLHEAGLQDFADIQRFAAELEHEIYGIEPGNDGNRLVLG